MPLTHLQWPMLGVIRRAPLRVTPGTRRESFPAPWAVNCRVYGNIDRRLRGGSRPGLTKYVNDDMGTTISDIASVNTSSVTGGASDILVALVDSTLMTVEGGTAATQIAYLTDESGDILTDASGNRIYLGTAPPPSGFLVVGQQHVFAVTTSGVTKMDPKTGEANTIVASAGTVPTNCTFGAVYRDRLCLSGEDNAIYMSKQGDYTDWDYGVHVGQAGRALAFQLAISSEVGALPTAMISHKDSHLLLASQRTLWVLSGDPGGDGSLRRISENVGIIARQAWCKIEDLICFLSTDGIYQVQADGSGLAPLSENAVPDEIRDVDTSTTTVSMGYEHDRRAVHVFLRTAAGRDNHWVYELDTESWWPIRFEVNDHSPVAVCQHDGELLLAGNDGYVRKIGGDDDDTAAIESHVAIGPMRLSRPGYYGRMINMHGILAAGGGTVNWRIVTGDTAEEAADNVKLAIEAYQSGGAFATYVKASGNWISGRAIMAYPRVRSVWYCLWLQSTDKWAFEGVTIERTDSGRWKGSSGSVVTAGVVSVSSSPSASTSSSPSTSASSSPSSSPSSSVSASPSSSTSSSPSSSPSST